MLRFKHVCIIIDFSPQWWLFSTVTVSEGKSKRTSTTKKIKSNPISATGTIDQRQFSLLEQFKVGTTNAAILEDVEGGHNAIIANAYTGKTDIAQAQVGSQGVVLSQVTKDKVFDPSKIDFASLILPAGSGTPPNLSKKVAT